MTKKEYIVVLILFTISSITLSLVNYLNISPNFAQQIIIACVIAVVIIFNFLRPSLISRVLNGPSKWAVLFVTNLVIQFIIITTGGPFSPFLMLVHLSTLGISLFFHFPVAGIFLFFSFINIVLTLRINPIIYTSILDDPTVLFVIAITFVAIVPLVRLISDTYHLRGRLLQRLHNQLSLEESLLADVEELIFITDMNLSILSTNDAVERTLLRSRTDLLHKNLFDVLSLKDSHGVFIKPDTFKDGELIPYSKVRTIPDLSLLAMSNAMRKVTLQIKRLTSVEGKFDQLVFIVTPANRLQPNPTYQHVNIEEASIKHKAFIEELKRKLLAQGLPDFAYQLLFVEKSEQDILEYRAIEDHGITPHKVPVDSVRLCKLALQNQQDFARVLKVPLAFSIVDLRTSPPASDQATQPVFNVFCDVKYFGMFIQKILEIALLIAASEPNPQTKLTVSQDDSSVTISVITSCPTSLVNLKDDIFLPHFGRLSDNTNLKLGSGLEGILAKTIADALNIDIKISFFDSKCSFTFQIPK